MQDHPRRIGLEIKKLSILLKRYYDNQMRSQQSGGLTGVQSWILFYLFDAKDECEIFQRDIEQKFNVRRSTVTGSLQVMEREGLIVRESVPEDGRLKRIRPTEKALSLYRSITEQIDFLEGRITAQLSEEEISEFFTISSKIQSALCEGGDTC
jgi:DNA-binding MarR family transcriptional regulator